MYCFIRADLPIEQQIVQAAHSALEAGRDLGKPSSNSRLILLEAKSQDQLLKISQRLAAAGIKFRMFYEPDHNRGYTSITTEPISQDEDRAFFKKYTLYKFKAETAYSAREEFSASFGELND